MFEKAGYFFRQALKNLLGRRIMSLAAISIVTAVLLLLGFSLSVSVNINELMNRLGDSSEINVYISKDAGGRTITDIEGELKEIQGIKDVKFFSREDRLKKASTEIYGDDGHSFSLGTNPLRDSYVVTLSDLTQISRISDEILAVQGVEELVKNNDIINGIDILTRAVRNIGLWINLLFMLIAVFIISNSVKLGISSHGEEIEIMKIVGATNGFITTPFIIQGVIIGFISALISSVLILCSYSVAFGRITMIISSDIFSFVSINRISALILPVFFISGISVGILGSITAVRRYLKN